MTAINDTREPLIQHTPDEDDQFVPESFGCCYSLQRALGMTISKERRQAFLNGTTIPSSYCTNRLNNQKYNVLTFIPKVLFNEFKYFFNMFFLIIALSQFIPFLKVGFMFTYVAPLVFVLMVTMIKEAFDDIKRYFRDRDLNNNEYERLTKDGFINQRSADFKVGQIIKIKQGQRVPADLILLYTSDGSGSIFIKTDQLDGETDWKLRKAIPQTQKSTETGIIHMDGYIMAQPPTDQIYEFMGKFKSLDEEEGLDLNNTVWSNTVLASTGFCLGMVIQTGDETRMQMNSKSPRQKTGRLDLEVNWLAKCLFVMMCVIGIIIIAIDGFVGTWYFKYFRVILLLSSIIPISMRINLDLAKIWYSICIATDDNIPDTVPRNSTIPEELGRIQFLLSDKTGTLTQNDMVFKKISMEFAQFSEETLPEMEDFINQSYAEAKQGPMPEIESSGIQEDLADRLRKDERNRAKKKKKKSQRDQHFVVRDLILALSLCHNVTPVYPDENDKSIKEYQASSPDEIALVKFAEELSMYLEDREEKFIQLKNPKGEEEVYEVLANFPFSSETKRMGIILRHKLSNKIMFYVKGADVAMVPKVKPGQRSSCQEFCENLAMEGLRTLVITQKHLTEEEFQSFDKRLRAARASMIDREKMVQDVISSLEENMEFLAVTGVEDKLQEDVLQTIENLRQAGVQIWMLTGDKIETAKCIAISTGLKSQKQGIFDMKELSDKDEILEHINEYKSLTSSHLLVVDGSTLKHISADEDLSYRFFDVTKTAKSVCVCRCSPTQKAVVARNIKEHTGMCIACVGDGGNDVAMIQEANVGLGIVGKEGMQASLASDFSITQFKHISMLLLWHGRLSYKRSASLAQFVVHRGMIISFIQAIFTVTFYFVTIPIYNGFLLLGYSTVYTTLPVFSIVLDFDVSQSKVKEYPALYITLQKGRSLNMKTFMIWVWMSCYQACIIMFVSVTQFNQSFVNIVSITFTTLILIECLNIMTIVSSIHRYMIISMVLTFGVYLLSFVMFPQYLQVGAVDGQFCLQVIIMTICCWLPLHLFKMIMSRCVPNQEEKVMREDQ